MSNSQTIFALASAAGRAGVAVFRISGKDAARAITELCAPSNVPEPRFAALRDITNPATNEIIDRALAIYFQSPNSFTGEDVVEFHSHGGRAIINAMTSALQAVHGFRLAEPGEFSRRAFENGKMDLTEAEAIADLVDAETEAQRKQALRQMQGALGQLYDKWRTLLSRGLAYMEAAIDFAEDELPADMIEKQSIALRQLRDEIAAHVNDGHRGERLREGFSIAILGAPNAGKSSLLNTLARREAAIVSPVAGTTRDVIDIHLDLGGYPVILADTAGLRDSQDAIEGEGIRRARARAEQADLKLLLVDATRPEIDAALQDVIDDTTIVLVNKIDLVTEAPSFHAHRAPLAISTLSGAGIDTLIQKLTAEIAARFDQSTSPPLTRARHRAALTECLEHLDRALNVVQADLRAEDVRMAMRALGRITGRVDVEDLLDIIFRDFCIGK